MRPERQDSNFRAHREIILSTGGFNKPKLLMLSGIGPRAELRAFGIPVHVNSLDVGENVQDHVLHGGCLYEAQAVRLHEQRGQGVGLLQD